MSCVAAGPFHILTGSDDSDVHVWSLAQLLELGSPAEHDPERSLSNHRAAITALALSPGSNPETSLCVSGSKDKSCILWNYHSGEPLRTLLFPSPPLCMALDPAVRALVVSTADASLYLAEFFARRPLLGATAEDASTVVQITNPFGAAPPDAGPASCVDVSYDGTTLLTGHPRGQILKWDIAENKTPVVVTNLNAAVTNLVFCPPFKMDSASQTPAIVKPSALAGRSYTLTTMLGTAPASSQQDTRFDTLLNTPGFSRDVLENAVVTAHEPGALTAGEHELQHQNEQLWEIVHEQRAIHKQMYRHLLGSRSS